MVLKEPTNALRNPRRKHWREQSDAIKSEKQGFAYFNLILVSIFGKFSKYLTFRLDRVKCCILLKTRAKNKEMCLLVTSLDRFCISKRTSCRAYAAPLHITWRRTLIGMS